MKLKSSLFNTVAATPSRDHLLLLSPSLANLGRETGLNRSDGPARTARVARDEVQPVLSLGEFGIGGAARLAGDVFDNVATKNVLDLLLLETTLDDEATGTVHGTGGTQFSEQELCHVFVSTLHTLADFGDVGEDGL